MEGKEQNQISVKVMCLIVNASEQRILVGQGYDSVKDERFYRLLGGSLNFGEKAEAGIRREIREELNCEIENLRFIEMVENIFTFEGKAGHEIIFLFRGDLTDKSIYKQETLHIIEADYEIDAEWVPIAAVIENKVILYPKYNYNKILTPPHPQENTIKSAGVTIS